MRKEFIQIIKKMPEQTRKRLKSYVENEYLTIDEKQAKITSYCSSLYDTGVLSFRERSIISAHFRDRAYRNHDIDEQQIIPKNYEDSETILSLKKELKWKIKEQKSSMKEIMKSNDKDACDLSDCIGRMEAYQEIQNLLYLG